MKETNLERDLGVNIDPNLTFDSHITSVIKNTRRMSGLTSEIQTIKNEVTEMIDKLYEMRSTYMEIPLM